MRKAVHKLDPETKRKKLDLMADKLADAGVAGDISAMREVGDRLDGKAQQSIEAVVVDKRMVVEAPAPAKDADEWAADHQPVH